MITKREYLDAIMKDKRLSSAQRELLRMLIDQRDRQGIVEPRVAQLMEYFNLSQTAVYNRIDRVHQNGYLREVGREGRQRFYEMTLPTSKEEEIATLEDRVARLEQELVEAREMGSRIRDLEKKVKEISGE